MDVATRPATGALLAQAPALESPFDALDPTDMDFSEKLSRKVLNSLRSLNESLGEVRASVARIDFIANNDNGSTSAAPPLPAAATAPPVPPTPAVSRSIDFSTSTPVGGDNGATIGSGGGSDSGASADAAANSGVGAGAGAGATAAAADAATNGVNATSSAGAGAGAGDGAGAGAGADAGASAGASNAAGGTPSADAVLPPGTTDLVKQLAMASATSGAVLDDGTLDRLRAVLDEDTVRTVQQTSVSAREAAEAKAKADIDAASSAAAASAAAEATAAATAAAATAAAAAASAAAAAAAAEPALPDASASASVASGRAGESTAAAAGTPVTGRGNPEPGTGRRTRPHKSRIGGDGDADDGTGSHSADGDDSDLELEEHHMTDLQFFAMEGEAAELRAARERMMALKAEREAEKARESAIVGADAAADADDAADATTKPNADAAPDAAGASEAKTQADAAGAGAGAGTGAGAGAGAAAATAAADGASPTAIIKAAADTTADAEWPTVPDTVDASGKPAKFLAFNLRIVYEAGRTGFEEMKDFQAPVGSVIAGRYYVRDFLGSAAFSSALSCEDLVTGRDVCLKVIKNNKDFLDQSLDEIKLLRYINAMGDPDQHYVLRLYEFAYFKEHLILVTELLKDNLYEFQKYLADAREAPYFTIPRLQRIAKQVLKALVFIHKLGLIHCDLKPENILIKSYSRCEVKVIDFGSSCYVTDHLSSYIQSRSYRAPEVILGLPYDHKIDVWSFGCILAELLTGRVMFQSDTIQSMLARMVGVIGNFPAHMLAKGRDVPKFFNSKGVVFERVEDGTGFVLLQPKRTSLAARLKCDDAGFISFVSSLLSLDPDKRPTAEEALQHPWLQTELEVEKYILPQ